MSQLANPSEPFLPTASERYRGVPELVEDWARIAPSSVAVEQGKQRWTYEQLVARASAIAAAIRRTGCPAGSVVAVLGDPGWFLLSTALGILKSGSVLLQLDPELPEKRRQFMLEQTRARLLFAPAPDGDVGAGEDIAMDAPEPAKVAPDQPPAGFDALELTGIEAPAYVFFTSGSTGTPKAVLGTHRGLVHFLNWQRTTFAIQPGVRVSQLSGLSFDVVLRDYFLPLTSGGTLCIPPSKHRRAPQVILPWLDESRIEVIHAVPSLMSFWLDHVPANTHLSHLKWVFFAGEPLPASLIERWRGRFPHAGKQVNLYGPTETTLAKFYKILPAVLEPGIQPVGRSLPNTEFYILDDALRPVAAGHSGQVAIRTPYRSLGYLNAAAETRRKFVPVPGSQAPSDLMYLTGDRGSVRPDGELQLLGRMDNQIKIRGIRIEPGEVESRLLRLPGINQAVVIPGYQDDQPAYLAAALVCSATGAHRPETIRNQLQQEMPDALIPSRYLFLETMPVNANGKVDRKQLEALLQAAGTERREIRPPETPEQQIMADIFADLLRVSPIGLDDHFFELGGNSLQAVVLAARIDEKFGLGLDFEIVFRTPILGDLSQRIQEARSHQPSAQKPISRLLEAGSGPKVFAFPPLLGYGLAYLRMARLLREFTFYALDFPDTTHPLDDFVGELLRLQDRGPYVFLGYSAGGNLAFDTAVKLEAAGRTVSDIIMLDSRRRIGPEVFTDEEMDEIVAGNLKYFAPFMSRDQEFKVFVDNPYVQRFMAGKIRAMLRYENGRPNEGLIRGNIHFIHSVDQPPCQEWAEATRGRFAVHQGFGRHPNMTNEEHLPGNTRIIHSLLKECVPL